MKTIRLASTSPRRHDLLKAAGLPFEVVPTDYQEQQDPAFSPTVNAMSAGYQKAQRAVALGAHGLVLGCDTIVVAENGEVLEKPADRADAARMIGLLSGRTHEVISGFGLIDTETNQKRVGSARSRVTVAALTPQELEAFLDTGEYEGKSGAYMIQGTMRRYVTEIEGPLDSIVGLPVEEIRQTIARMEENV